MLCMCVEHAQSRERRTTVIPKSRFFHPDEDRAMAALSNVCKHISNENSTSGLIIEGTVVSLLK
jgi:hypothetical protein